MAQQGEHRALQVLDRLLRDDFRGHTVPRIRILLDAGGASWKEVNENHPLYAEYGLPVELHRPEDLRIIPLVTNTEGVAGLSISRKAGLIDHYSLRNTTGARRRRGG